MNRARPLPPPHELAAVGALLCLYRVHPGGELGGWAQAVRTAYASGIDHDGVHERLLFFDREDRCCWQLHVLPDSDFLAWERLVAGLATHQEDVSGGLGERLWRRLAARLQGGQWRGSALRLHALPSGPGYGLLPALVLAASPASLSRLGAAVARRIAYSEGAGSEALADECCCSNAPRAHPCSGNDDRHGHGGNADPERHVYSLIRFNNLREQA